MVAWRQTPPAALQRSRQSVVAKWGGSAATPAAGGWSDPVSPHQAQPPVLSSLRFFVDHRSQHTRPAVAAGLSGSLGDGGQSSGREDHLGGGAGAGVESQERGSTTGAGGGRLWGVAMGELGGLRGDSERSVSPSTEVAPTEPATVLPGSGHSITPAVARAAQDRGGAGGAQSLPTDDPLRG